MANNETKDVLNKSVINWYPGHMAKTKREIKEKLDLIDLVFELIDARIPYSSKNKDIDNIVSNKKRVIIMTKIDMCDIINTEKWIKYYEEKNIKVIKVDLINKKNINEILAITDKVREEVNIKRKEKNLKERKLRILILGIPNVGKSTLINTLVGKKSANVGNKPGITRHLEWIRINNNLELLDTPGILAPKLDDYVISHNLASLNAIKGEVLDNEDIAIYVIKKMLELYKDNIISRYNLTSYNDIVDILDNIGRKIGAVKNNETDYEKVYNIVLRDLREGYLGKITFDRLEE